MSERKTIRINIDNYDKLMDLKELKGYKSLNEILDNLLPKGTAHQTDYECEPPAFAIKGHEISWTALKKSDVNTTWQSGDGEEIAIVIFKDQYGALVRFQFDDDFYVNYFHFLK
ncbi:MAG: hypothetical protein IJF83_03375 [Methanobrevibacter sp.]|nr:hypothetical protein [Methanobrevibacter sp.]